MKLAFCRYIIGPMAQWWSSSLRSSGRPAFGWSLSSGRFCLHGFLGCQSFPLVRAENTSLPWTSGDAQRVEDWLLVSIRSGNTRARRGCNRCSKCRSGARTVSLPGWSQVAYTIWSTHGWKVPFPFCFDFHESMTNSQTVTDVKVSLVIKLIRYLHLLWPLI